MSFAQTYTPPTIPGPAPDTVPPRFLFPPGACDCHAHIFGPQSRYAYDPKRRYTPPDALISDYVRMLRVLGVERAVLVQPSVYMTDNSALIDGLAEAAIPVRGVVAVAQNITDVELERMHARGVRGVRFNLRVENGTDAGDLPGLAKRIVPLGWHLEMRVTSDNYPLVLRILDQIPVDIVVDHIGQIKVGEGLQGNDFQALLALVRTGRIWVKLSAPMRVSQQSMPYADVTPFVRELAATGPERMLWASDWPHTGITGAMPNDGELANLLMDWIPDKEVRKRVLVDNPACCYGF